MNDKPNIPVTYSDQLNESLAAPALDPTYLLVANDFLAGQSIDEIAKNHSLTMDQVTSIIENKEVKSYVDNVYLSQGYLNRQKRLTVINKVIDEKLQEAFESGVYSKKDLLDWMKDAEADYTNTFAGLCYSIPNTLSPWEQEAFLEWKYQWDSYAKSKGITMEERIQLMRMNNPVVIPRNHLVESILAEIDQLGANTAFSKRFHEAISTWNNPYTYDESLIPWMMPPTVDENQSHQTFCGT